MFSSDSTGSRQISPNSWIAWDLSCICSSIESGTITHISPCSANIPLRSSFLVAELSHTSCCQVIYWLLMTSELLLSNVCWLIYCRKWGMLGLFKGLEAKLLQTVLTAALMFLLYEKIASTTFRVMGVKRTVTSHWASTGCLAALWCQRNFMGWNGCLCYEQWSNNVCFLFVFLNGRNIQYQSKV